MQAVSVYLSGDVLIWYIPWRGLSVKVSATTYKQVSDYAYTTLLLNVFSCV